MAKRRGQSAAFMARIRKLRGKSKASKSIKLTRRFKYMARKAKRKSFGKSSGAMNGIMGTAVGVGAYILFETMVEPKLLAMANISNPLLVNAGELIAGLYLSRKPGILGQMGKAAVIINTYQILYPYLSTLGTSNSMSPSLSLFS
jgi:hypothetical protein